MISVIIPASGVGARFGASIPKQFVNLNGEHILKRTISIFQNLHFIDEIAVTVPNGYAQTVQNYDFDKVHHIVEGGKTRADSVFSALKMLQSDIVLIHDGVRPFVANETVQAVINAVKKHGAALACVPVTDTIKVVTDTTIKTTLDRSQLWSAQTPQGFTYEMIMGAYTQAQKDGILNQVTDDSTVAEHIGIPVYIVPSSPKNIKITTEEDLLFAEAILNSVGNESQPTEIHN